MDKIGKESEEVDSWVRREKMDVDEFSKAKKAKLDSEARRSGPRSPSARQRSCRD